MGLRLVISVLLGGLFGECARRLSIILILKRTEEKLQSNLLISRWSPVIWILFGALGCGAVSLIISDLAASIELMGIFLVLLSLSAVDSCIRKIPNELLLALLMFKIVAMVINPSISTLLSAIIGFFAGWILFIIPAQIGIGIGWGDVKLAASAGFCLGWFGLFQAVMIMSVVIGFYTLYLYITRKGTLKTALAYGPPLSLGVIVTLLFPLAAAI